MENSRKTKTMLKLIAAALAVTMSAALLTGCSSNGEAQSSAEAPSNSIEISVENSEQDDGDSAAESEDQSENASDVQDEEESSEEETKVFDVGEDYVPSNESDFEVSEAVNGKLTIVKYKGSDSDVKVPKTIKGQAVSYIEHEVFKDMPFIKSITIPANIVASNVNGVDFRGTNIEKAVLYSKISIISETIKEAEVWTSEMPNFARCASIEKVSGFKIESIRDDCFEGCTSLKTLDFDSIGGKIGYEAFKNCKSLKEINLDAVSSIGVSAFAGCTSLSSVKITMAEGCRIEDEAFIGCQNLKSITFDGADCYPGGYLGFVEDHESVDLKKVEGLTIIARKGTMAEEYAEKNGFAFVELS